MSRTLATAFRRPARPGRGAINFGCVFGGLLVLVMIYLALKFVPVKVAVAEVKDTATREAEMASIKKDGDIGYAIMQKVRENHLPISETAIQIHRSASEIQVKFDIDVPIELIGGKTYHYKESVDLKRTLF